MELANLPIFLSSEDLWARDHPSSMIRLNSGCHRWIEPAPLVVLAVALRTRITQYNAPIQIDFSQARHPGFLERMSFFSLIGVEAPACSGTHHDQSGRFIPLRLFASLKDVDNFIRQAALLLDADTVEIGPYIKRSFEEAMRNAIQHAGSNPAFLNKSAFS